ncbi:hypothetical protein [Antarctobacter heliothermus]|uniref:Uncharacterized protein n=1 Tax=Antarctobacter heliothermus TaxID=74033 RepID=A0A239IIR3_9RHOB|nr:hypothetical protein [Antarctobacter heliothermus]SNS93441.1 hypothetical protein SAMN04488078_104317 [Antarctobacter heliothermus]
MSGTRPGVIKRLWQDAPWLTGAFVLALVCTLFFAGRFVTGAIYWADPAHRDVPPASWMTPRYVAHSWRLPPDMVADTLALPRDGTGGRFTLGQLAADRDVPVDTLIAELEAAIARHREAHP